MRLWGLGFRDLRENGEALLDPQRFRVGHACCLTRGLGFGFWVLGFGVEGLGFGVGGLGVGVWGVGCGVWGVGCGVWGLGLGVDHLGVERWLHAHRPAV